MQITKTLPKLINRSIPASAEEGFQDHLIETENQLARLQQIFNEGEVRDAGPIAAA